MEIQPNFLSEEADREALINAVEIVLQIAKQPAFKAIVKSRVAPARWILSTVLYYGIFERRLQ